MKPKDLKDLRSNVNRELDLISKPLDLDELIANGTLIKDGTWYRVTNFHDLPEHVSKRIAEIKHSPEGARVKFFKVSSRAQGVSTSSKSKNN